MKLKTEQEIKLQANKEAEEYHPHIEDIYPDKYFTITESFHEGASWMQREVLASASEGFDEYMTQETHNGKYIFIGNHLSTWQACSLYHAKKMQEKDAEIEMLKRELELAKKQEYHPLTNPWRIKCGNLASDLQFVLGVSLRDGYVPFADLVRFEEIKHRFNLSETPNSSKEGVK